MPRWAEWRLRVHRCEWWSDSILSTYGCFHSEQGHLALRSAVELERPERTALPLCAVGRLRRKQRYASDPAQQRQPASARACVVKPLHEGRTDRYYGRPEQHRSAG